MFISLSRKIASFHPNDNQETDSFIQRPHHHRPSSIYEQKNRKYHASERFYDRLLSKFEHYLRRNRIVSALFCFILIASVFGIAFLCVISVIATQHTIKECMGNSCKATAMASIDSPNITKKIRILLISDIHLNKSNVAKVDEYIKANKVRVDHLWAPGDFLKMKEKDNDDEKLVEEGEKDLIDLLAQIRKIHPFPVIIPGNHDPNTLFFTESEKYFKFGECVNIHKKLYRVEGESNLFMAGFGGSVPALCENEVLWEGYPYSNEEEFAKEYNAFIDAVIADKKEVMKTNKSVVLFTHNGPSMCSTSMDWRKNDETKVIECGSSSILRSLLNEKLRDRIICNIHGHTHAGVGQGHIGNGVPIINPGSLKGGEMNHNFALLELAQMKDETWKVSSVEFKNTKNL